MGHNDLAYVTIPPPQNPVYPPNDTLDGTFWFETLEQFDIDTLLRWPHKGEGHCLLAPPKTVSMGLASKMLHTVAQVIRSAWYPLSTLRLTANAVGIIFFSIDTLHCSLSKGFFFSL